MADWSEKAKEDGAKGKAEAGLIDEAKPADKKKIAEKAIDYFEKAAAHAKEHDTLAWALWLQEAAKVHRKLGDHAKAAGIEEDTAKELEKAAKKAADDHDPERAGQLERIAQQKWNRASDDRTNSTKPAAPPPDAAKDKDHAKDAGKKAEAWEKQAANSKP